MERIGYGDVGVAQVSALCEKGQTHGGISYYRRDRWNNLGFSFQSVGAGTATLFFAGVVAAGGLAEGQGF